MFKNQAVNTMHTPFTIYTHKSCRQRAIREICGYTFQNISSGFPNPFGKMIYKVRKKGDKTASARHTILIFILGALIYFICE
jgi:hypothetical protein